jgi:hypothetical protein
MAKNTLDYYVQKLDGEPFRLSRYDQSLYDLFEKQAPAGRYKVTLQRKLPDKSHKQLGVVFGLVVSKTLEAFEELGYDTSYIIKSSRPSGIAVSPDLLKEYLYAVCPIFRNGIRITLSKMDVAEANQFIEAIRNYISAEWGIYIPEPDKNWRQSESKNPQPEI